MFVRIHHKRINLAQMVECPPSFLVQILRQNEVPSIGSIGMYPEPVMLLEFDNFMQGVYRP
jgi:hypothetical protein